MADLSTLTGGMQTAMTWIFGLFTDVINVIVTNDLLLWPALLFIVMAAIGLVIGIVRKFGLRSRRS